MPRPKTAALLPQPCPTQEPIGPPPPKGHTEQAWGTPCPCPLPTSFYLTVLSVHRISKDLPEITGPLSSLPSVLPVVYLTSSALKSAGRQESPQSCMGHSGVTEHWDSQEPLKPENLAPHLCMQPPHLPNVQQALTA
jgi:hypothetical protein